MRFLTKNLNLKISKCKAFEIIQNGIKLEPISWEAKTENSFFNFCVGVKGNGRPPADFLYSLYDLFVDQKMHIKISYLLILIIWTLLNAEQFYEPKMDFTGVEIAWVDIKSNKYPLFHM